MSFARELRYYAQILKEIIFPRICTVCGYHVDNGMLCEKCRKHYLLQRQLKYTPREEYLAGQAAPLPEDVLSSVLLLYKYDGVLKDAMHRLKFEGAGELLPMLQEEAEAALPNPKLRWLSQFDIVATIPTSKERKEQRGYDVPAELFLSILEQRDLTACADLLQRERRTAPLFALDKQQRQAELAGCFGITPRYTVAGKRILLCDDIYTTGTTMAEAARVLLAAGAASVHGLALCGAQANWGTEADHS